MSNTSTLDLDSYSTSFEGSQITTNNHNLQTIWDGDYKFEDISAPDTGGLSWYSKKIEVQSRSDSNWTIVRLSRQDSENFSLENFTYQPEGAHTYKLVNPSGYEYEVSSDSSQWGGSGDSINSNILENNFSDISYVDFYSRAITVTETWGGREEKTTLDLDSYSTSFRGSEITNNTHNLEAIWDGDYKFEDISAPDTGGLTWWTNNIEVISDSDSNWTKVRLSRQDGEAFNLENFTFEADGAHTYKLVNSSGYEYEVSKNEKLVRLSVATFAHLLFFWLRLLGHMLWQICVLYCGTDGLNYSLFFFFV